MIADRWFVQVALVVAGTVLVLGGFNVAAGIAVALFVVVLMASIL